MKFFEKYTSASVAGSGNQSIFKTDGKDTEYVSRVYYKIYTGGKREYSLLYTNITDSTYADGSINTCNVPIDEWNIIYMKAGIVDSCSMDNAVEPKIMYPLTFDGCSSKIVSPCEFFSTDGIILDIKKGQYLCIETKFSGTEIPCHPESVIPAFVRDENGIWNESRNLPFAAMVGCERKTESRICFWGDSITQGVGTEGNSYTHFAAVISEILGDRYAYWDIGLGFARANDGASRGAWMFKAKQNDLVVLCLGVNDMGSGFTYDEICRDLRVMIKQLKKEGIKIIIQTLPPFDYEGKENIEKWYSINRYVKETLAPMCDGYFDNVAILGKKDSPNHTIYGGHPDSRGHRLWGEALAEEVRRVLEKK